MEKKVIFDDYMDEVVDEYVELQSQLGDLNLELDHGFKAEELNFRLGEAKHRLIELEKAVNRELYRRSQAEMKANPRAYMPLGRQI